MNLYYAIPILFLHLLLLCSSGGAEKDRKENYERARKDALKAVTGEGEWSEGADMLSTHLPWIRKERDPAECSPDDALCLHLAAGTLIHHSRYKEALRTLDKALEIEKEQPAIYKTRALVYLRMEEWDKALADANSSLALNPHDETAMTYMEHAEKRKTLLTGVELDITDEEECIAGGIPPMECYGLVTGALLKKRKVEEALRPLSKAIDYVNGEGAAEYSDKERATYYAYRAKAHQQRNHYPEAIQDAEKAIELDPDADPLVKSILETSKQDLSLLEEAKEGKLTEENCPPGVRPIDCYREVFRATVESGQFERAVGPLTKAIEYVKSDGSPDYEIANFYNFRAIIHYGLKRYHEVIADADSALAYNSAHTGAQKLRMLAQEQQDKMEASGGKGLDHESKEDSHTQAEKEEL